MHYVVTTIILCLEQIRSANIKQLCQGSVSARVHMAYYKKNKLLQEKQVITIVNLV